MSSNRSRIFVSPHEGHWVVHWEGTSAASKHRMKPDAIMAAKKMVAALAEGECGQIIVKGEDGTFQTEWTYGKDPFPPEG